jgi:hypothetical protein
VEINRSKTDQPDRPDPGGLGNGSFIAGYDNMNRLREFVEASLHGGGNADLIIAMTIATCKNLIDEKLEGEQQ